MAVRERGDGSVYQRGRLYWIKFSVRGRAIRESSQSTQRTAALALLRRRLAEVASGQHAAPSVKCRLTDLIGLVADDYQLNGRRSMKRTRQAFRHVQDFFGDIRARDITAESLTGYVRTRMRQGAAAATIANELAALKRALTLAVRMGTLLRRPVFPEIRVHNARCGFFEEAEFRSLCAELPTYLRAPVTFAYLTGWRLTSEVLSLKWDQVDFDHGAIRLEAANTKNGEAREWPLRALPQINSLLEAQRDSARALSSELGSATPFVFHHNGRQIRSMRSAWVGACARAGLAERIPHDFRRTAVRNFERAGVARSVAMRLVGHRTESVYRRYAIVASRDLIEGVARLAASKPAA